MGVVVVDLARFLVARTLNERGDWDAGVHPEHGTVIYWERRIWRVSGGDLTAPSLIGLAGVRVNDVRWVVDRTREEPVT